MSIAKDVSICAIATGALFAAGATFVPGTAEAHCGEHAGTCQGRDYAVGDYCRYDHHVMFIMNVYDGLCARPILNCSPGSTCPCADGACDPGPNSCYLYTYDWDTGMNCGS